jgi:TonB family protein
MLIYFLNTIIALGLFFLLYSLLLKNAKSFRWNRIYLLLSSIISILLPLASSFTWVNAKSYILPNPSLRITLQTINVFATNIQHKELDFGKIIFGIYCVGLLWGLVRIILGYIVIKRIKTSSKVEKINAQYIHFNHIIDSPFSFMGAIFVPFSLKQKEVLRIIIEHEQAHIKLFHSRDKIYFSILQALFWFNPFVYIYHKEIELIHEFEADEFATQQFAKDDYVQNLLTTITYQQTPTLLVHHFFHHPLKTRITMLYKKSKNVLLQKATITCASVTVCVCLFIVQSFAQNKASKSKFYTTPIGIDKTEIENSDKSNRSGTTQTIPDTIYEYAEQMPEFPEGDKAMQSFIQKNIRYPKNAQYNGISGKVIIKFIVDENGNMQDVQCVRKPNKGEDLEQEAIRIVELMPQWIPGKNNNKTVKVQYLLPIVFSLTK